MNGPQDIGGAHGFGAIDPDPDEPLFHAPWERRAMALTLAAGALGRWSIDESRHAREDRHPADYHRLTYYQLWIVALERLLLRHGLVTEAEIAAGQALHPAPPDAKPLKAADVPAALAKGSPYERDPGGRQPAFRVGDRVRTRNLQPRGHIRLPAYARDKLGRIEAVQGFHVFADRSAVGEETADWLYTVAFDAPTLWGEAAPAGDAVSIDAWEPYLVHA
jgi:nitrile hydratase